MKWFRHETDASRSEKLTRMIEDLGIEAYARWWLLLERVAERMDETDNCSAEYTIGKWCEYLRCKQKILKTFLEYSGNILGIKQKQNGNVLRITIPKLLEKRDNYTKNLQATGKRLASIEVEVEVDKKNIPLPPSSTPSTPSHSSPASAGSNKGTRLSKDLQLTTEWRDIAAKFGLNGKVERVFAEFVDYWIAVPGARGVKLDWTATWRNRCRSLGVEPQKQKPCTTCLNKAFMKNGYHQPCPTCKEMRH